MASNKMNNRVKRQGRRVVPAIRRSKVAAQVVAAKVQTTLGDLIAAAFDAASGSSKDAAKILSSSELAAATGRKVVFI